MTTPPQQDVLPEQAAAPIGGRLGQHASARSGSWGVLTVRIVALVAVPLVLSVVRQGHCIRYGWSGTTQFWRMCFSDLPAQYQLAGLSSGLTGYLDGASRLDQPSLAGAVMATLGGLVPTGGVVQQTRWYVLMWVALITVLLMLTVWCTAATRPEYLQAAVQVALSPIIFLTALISSDVLAVALVAVAMLAWRRRWLVTVGAALGLGVFARSYVLVVAIALLYAAWRSERLADARRALAYAALAALAVLIPMAVTNADATFAAYRAWWSNPASYGSPWLIPQLVGFPLPVPAVTALAVLGWVAALAFGWTFARDSARPPSWAQVAFVMVAIVVVTGKQFPVQASLWLLPLAALAGTRWRDMLLWASAESVHWVAVWLFIGTQTSPDRGLPGPWYLVALVLRLAAIVLLVRQVWAAAAYPTLPSGRTSPLPGTATTAESPAPPSSPSWTDLRLGRPRHTADGDSDLGGRAPSGGW